MEYPDNSLEGFRNGALLDLRVRYAMDLLKSEAVGLIGQIAFDVDEEGDSGSSTRMVAEIALDLADAVLGCAEVRGWVKPLESGLSEAVERQAALTGAFGALQQVEGQKYAQGLQSKVVSRLMNG